MLIPFAGLLLCLWAISSGFGAPSFSRSTVFIGPIGFIVNMVVLLAGAGLMALGFAFLM